MLGARKFLEVVLSNIFNAPIDAWARAAAIPLSEQEIQKPIFR